MTKIAPKSPKSGEGNMINDGLKIYHWEGLFWEIRNDSLNGNYAAGLCPKQKCCCELVRSTSNYSRGEYKYDCPRCDFKKTLNKVIREKGDDFLRVQKSFKYKDAEVINIDGELIKVQKEEIKDNDYWIQAKISKNNKEELQLMVLAGSKKDKDKAQLFLDPTNERLAFDQNNDHPSQIFVKVVGTFKNSKSEIHSKND